MKYLVLVGLALSLSSLHLARANDDLCTPKWKGDEAVVKGTFANPLEITCRVPAQGKPDFKKLKDFFETKYIRGKDLVKIMTGPLDESYEGLPSQIYSVQSIIKDHGTLNYERTCRIATNLSDRLIYQTTATKTKGSGDLSWLRRIEDQFTVYTQAEGDAVAVYVKMQSLRGIRKPPLASLGGGEFERRVKSEVLKDFTEVRDSLIKAISANI